jgi:hypothetical protein
MPPRLSKGATRVLLSQRTLRLRIQHRRRFASTSADAPEVYDVVCVGGGPAGLSLLAGLKASPITNGLKVALIEGQDLQKNRLSKDASLDSFSNRCSSLTPASVKNLQGEYHLQAHNMPSDQIRNWSMVACEHRSSTTLPRNAGMGWRHGCANILRLGHRTLNRPSEPRTAYHNRIHD